MHKYMLLELLSTSNYISFNIKLAHIIGLEGAVYVSEVLNINDKAVRKKKTTNGKYFTVDREYLEKRTTIPEKRQEEIEKALLGIDLLEKVSGEKDTLCLNLDTLMGLISEKDERLLKSISYNANPDNKKKKKQEQTFDQMMSYVVTDNAELRTAYGNWIQALLDNKKPVTSVGMATAQKRVDEYSKRNLDVALKLLEIATIRCYVDMGWAINAFEKEMKPQLQIVAPTESKVPVQRKKLGTEVF